jgi:hypothetical protein
LEEGVEEEVVVVQPEVSGYATCQPRWLLYCGYYSSSTNCWMTAERLVQYQAAILCADFVAVAWLQGSNQAWVVVEAGAA